MRKEIIYYIFIVMLLTSCEEYYKPAIDPVKNQLVVDAMITNDPSLNYVHLTYTRNFSDNVPITAVTGARVELVEINGNVIKGVENVWGFFIFKIVPVVGNNYKLRIFLQKDVYESEEVTMPPLPTITNFHTEHVEKKISLADGFGDPISSVMQGTEMYADAPVTNSLSYYRFKVRSILQWIYVKINFPETKPPPAPIYGWQSVYESNLFNLAGPKKFSQIEEIKMHPLLMLAYKYNSYINSDTLAPNGWILIIDQYGTSKGSHEYHEKLNGQFSAEGNLFDPIQTQVYGNIKCLTDPEKIVFGYFELNSHQQYRFYYDMADLGAVMTLRQLFRYPDIPDTGRTETLPPEWWEK